MEKTSVIVVAGLVIAAIYIALKTLGAIRRVGILVFSRALCTFVSDVLKAIWKLFQRMPKQSSAPSVPMNFAGTGGRYNARTGSYDNGQDPFGMYTDDESPL